MNSGSFCTVLAQLGVFFALSLGWQMVQAIETGGAPLGEASMPQMMLGAART